jgi:hypothetical protein
MLIRRSRSRRKAARVTGAEGRRRDPTSRRRFAEAGEREREKERQTRSEKRRGKRPDVQDGHSAERPSFRRRVRLRPAGHPSTCRDPAAHRIRARRSGGHGGRSSATPPAVAGGHALTFADTDFPATAEWRSLRLTGAKRSGWRSLCGESASKHQTVISRVAERGQRLHAGTTQRRPGHGPERWHGRPRSERNAGSGQVRERDAFGGAIPAGRGRCGASGAA